MLDKIKFNYVQDKFTREDGNTIHYKDIKFRYDELQEWISENESEIIKDICTRANTVVGKKHIPNVYLVYLGKSSKKNFMRSLEELSVWGFPEGNKEDYNKKTEDKLYDISNIKAGDIMVFLQGWTSSYAKDKRGRVTSDEFVGEIGEVTAVIVNEGYYYDNTKLWDDKDDKKEVFPHRVNFDKYIFFNSKNVPCDKLALGYLYDLIYDCYVNKRINRIDVMSMLKLININ